MKRPFTTALVTLLVAGIAGEALALNPQPLPPRRVPITHVIHPKLLFRTPPHRHHSPILLHFTHHSGHHSGHHGSHGR